MIGETEELNPGEVRRVVLCSGKVYFDLLESRRKSSTRTAAIVRIEQLYPFPQAELTAALAPYAHASEIIWCQEEPENQGAWHQIRDHLLRTIPSGIPLSFAARPICAAPAVGQYHRHLAEQNAVIEKALIGHH